MADIYPQQGQPLVSVTATARLGALTWGPAWLIWRSLDGRCFNGEGADIGEAMRDARRKWRGSPLPLAVNGHEYRRRQAARARRRR